MYKAIIEKDGKYVTQTRSKSGLQEFMKGKDDSYVVRYEAATSSIPNLDVWIDQNPTGGACQVLIYNNFRIRPPEDCDTPEKIREFLNKQAEAFFTTEPAKEKPNKTVPVSVVVRDRYSYDVRKSEDRTFDITMDIPLNILEEGEDSIDTFIRENYENYGPTDYGDTDESDGENYESEVRGIKIEDDINDILEEARKE